ncbi:hypothetical protein SDJN02_09172, partial [Cucurbita argyrosperma subsp. argyrosperma]
MEEEDQIVGVDKRRLLVLHLVRLPPTLVDSRLYQSGVYQLGRLGDIPEWFSDVSGSLGSPTIMPNNILFLPLKYISNTVKIFYEGIDVGYLQANPICQDIYFLQGIAYVVSSELKVMSFNRDKSV